MNYRHKHINGKQILQFSFMTMKSFSITASCLFLVISLGCKKLVEVDPPFTSTNGPTVYASDATAAAVLTNIYAKMSQLGPTNGSSIFTSFALGLSSDELTLFSGSSDITHIRYYGNSLSVSPALSLNFWNNFYPIIFVANSAIEGLESASTLTPAVKQQLLGEARFMRAFCYFYLVNLYGDVPKVVGTDYTINSNIPRAPKAEIWDLIISDLKQAKILLSPKYLKADVITAASERVRPSKWAAIALLARAYLYNGDPVNAEMESTEIINNTVQFNLNSLSNAFLANSSESIWQLQPVNTGWNTEDARVFILTGAPNQTKPVSLSNNLVNSFEIGDNRKVNWVNSVTVGTTNFYYPVKYKSATQNASVTEYTTVFRLAEQYLIRAEARAQQNKIAEAQADLNLLRIRAGLPNTLANSKATMLDAILHERQVELFTEWGHRWLDLIRTGNADAVMTTIMPQKNGTWEVTDKLYPIPLQDLQRNPNLVQNPSY